LTASNFKKIHFKDVIGDFPCCSMASSLEFYRERKDLVRDLVGVIRESIECLDDKREEAARELSSLIGFNWRIVMKSFDSYKFVCRLDNKDFRFLERYGLKLTPENVRSVATFL